MNDIAIRKIEKTILEVMSKRWPGAKFDRNIRADFRAMAVAIAKSGLSNVGEMREGKS